MQLEPQKFYKAKKQGLTAKLEKMTQPKGLLTFYAVYSDGEAYDIDENGKAFLFGENYTDYDLVEECEAPADTKAFNRPQSIHDATVEILNKIDEYRAFLASQLTK